MKTLIVAFLLPMVFAVSTTLKVDDEAIKCNLMPYDITIPWRDMVDPCIKEMRAQVKEELAAAMTYMSMGAHFAKDLVNRPGFSKFFFNAANEEREHAIKIMEYLLMRGELTKHLHTLINEPMMPKAVDQSTGVKALESALKLEVHVTKRIRNIIKTCESSNVTSAEGEVYNDYHLVDYLTGDFLEEQLKGQRELAGMISTLGKMVGKHGKLGEFLYDKKLLNGEVL